MLGFKSIMLVKGATGRILSQPVQAAGLHNLSGRQITNGTHCLEFVLVIAFFYDLCVIHDPTEIQIDANNDINNPHLKTF